MLHSTVGYLSDKCLLPLSSEGLRLISSLVAFAVAILIICGQSPSFQSDVSVSDVTVSLIAFRCTSFPNFTQMYQFSSFQTGIPVSCISGRCTCLPHSSQMYIPVSLIQSDVPVSFILGRCTGLPHFSQMYVPVTLIQMYLSPSFQADVLVSLIPVRCTYQPPSFSQIHVPVSFISGRCTGLPHLNQM